MSSDWSEDEKENVQQVNFRQTLSCTVFFLDISRFSLLYIPVFYGYFYLFIEF
jgi:hypothetical protein